MSRPTDTNNTPLSIDMIDEDRVRRALGLKTGSGTTHQQRPEQARQRHRFATDGSVPVVMLNRSDSDSNGLKERLTSAEHALEAERAAHAATRRSLQEAQQAHQGLQTRFGHTELSRNETLQTERDARRDAEEALAAIRAEMVQLQAAHAAELVRLREVEVAAVPIKVRREIKAIQPIVRQKRGPANEPKPVRWWTPSYRAKQG